jgi:hypothetical protein
MKRWEDLNDVLKLNNDQALEKDTICTEETDRIVKQPKQKKMKGGSSTRVARG